VREDLRIRKGRVLAGSGGICLEQHRSGVLDNH